MKSIRMLMILASCGTGLATAALDAFSQPYPARPIRFIVPFVPGGSADFFARAIAPGLSDGLGQQVVVDNRGGAGGTVGTELASRAAPDGYTVLLATANTAMNVSLYTKWTVDPLKDFDAVSLLGSAPNILAVHPSLPAKTVKDLIALAKSRPGQINYASGGSGSTSHLATELFKTMAGVELLHVPYKGTGPAMIAVLSGESAVVIPPASVVLPHMKTARLRALAIASATRLETVPDLPTMAESGVPRYEASQWYGLVVPRGAPQEVVSQLNRELVKVVQNPDLKARLLAQATTVVGSTPQQFAIYLRDEVDKWARVVKVSGARVE